MARLTTWSLLLVAPPAARGFLLAGSGRSPIVSAPAPRRAAAVLAAPSPPSSGAWLPVPPDLADEQLLKIVLQEMPDQEVNDLVWKYLGYRYDEASAGWDASAVFPNWAAKYPQPPDLIGVTRTYTKDVDEPVREALTLCRSQLSATERPVSFQRTRSRVADLPRGASAAEVRADRAQGRPAAGVAAAGLEGVQDGGTYAEHDTSRAGSHALLLVSPLLPLASPAPGSSAAPPPRARRRAGGQLAGVLSQGAERRADRGVAPAKGRPGCRGGGRARRAGALATHGHDQAERHLGRAEQLDRQRAATALGAICCRECGARTHANGRGVLELVACLRRVRCCYAERSLQGESGSGAILRTALGPGARAGGDAASAQRPQRRPFIRGRGRGEGERSPHIPHARNSSPRVSPV